MNKYLSYEDMTLEVLQCTLDPDHMTAVACAMTQKQEVLPFTDIDSTSKLVKFLFIANHTSVFEHSHITFSISNVSRSFLAQITRHRIGSFTSASQHYQEYGDYPNIFTPDFIGHPKIMAICDVTDALYKQLIHDGYPKEEARQILINAKGVNILWTVNARSLLNFFNQRLCKRNVQEMLLFAQRLHERCINWWPTLFKLAGPDCVTLGHCTQGHMRAEVCKNEIPTVG